MLKTVSVTIDIVVDVAEDEDAAQVARSYMSDALSDGGTTFSSCIVNPYAPGNGWSDGCLPYNRDDDLTIGQILKQSIEQKVDINLGK